MKMYRTKGFQILTRNCCETLFDNLGLNFSRQPTSNSFHTVGVVCSFPDNHSKRLDRGVQAVPIPRPTLFQSYSKHAFYLLKPTLLNQYLTMSRSASGGKHPVPKVPPSKIMRHYDIHGSISDEDSAKQFVFALGVNERKKLLKELENFRDLEQRVGQASKPSRQQLKQVALHQTFPFIGFGFLDNLLMICFGEYIDVTLGTAFGISTMAAAALGNLLSDVGGIGSASYVESFVSRLGVRAPQLSPEQVEMKITRWASSLGKAIGVAVGCLLGMFPLLFFSSDESKESKEGKESKESKEGKESKETPKDDSSDQDKKD